MSLPPQGHLLPAQSYQYASLKLHGFLKKCTCATRLKNQILLESKLLQKVIPIINPESLFGSRVSIQLVLVSIACGFEKVQVPIRPLQFAGIIVRQSAENGLQATRLRQSLKYRQTRVPAVVVATLLAKQQLRYC